MGKIILHIDFNSFFASVEQQANPFLRGKAIAVSGKGKYSMDLAHDGRKRPRFSISQTNFQRTVITTASIEAKKRGVKTAMSSYEAKRICPELIIIPGDPKKYAQVTKHFLGILARYADAVEQFSADEAFADVSFAGGDYFGATMIAQMIRDDIRKEIGEYCTASIGIAPNKLVAKLAGESEKPNGLTVILPNMVADFVASRELEAICGIGPRIAKRLGLLGATTVLGLRAIPRETLFASFKSYGYFLYHAARGEGDDSVSSVPEPAKSIGHSYTFPYDLDTEVELQTNLLALCDKVAARMRRDGFCATRVSVYARYEGFDGVGRERKFDEPMFDGLELYKNAWAILDPLRDTNRGIRLLGISASGLVPITDPQRIFAKDQKVRDTLRALDRVEARYGRGAWSRASTMNTSFKERISGWHYDHEL